MEITALNNTILDNLKKLGSPHIMLLNIFSVENKLLKQNVSNCMVGEETP